MGIFNTIATLVGTIINVRNFRDRYKWKEAEKKVNSKWWESSDLKKDYETNGYNEFRWSRLASVEERKAKGYEIIYEEDKPNRIKYKLVDESGSVLIGKINTTNPFPH